MAENVNNTIKTTVELDVGAAQMEIVKLNAAASDGAKDLSERLEAKNKQIGIQNSLNKKAIADLEEQVKGLTGVIGSEKKLEQAQKKLNKAKLDEVKVNTKNAQTQKKLEGAYEDSKGAINKLNNATGGFIDKLKLLATNPIVLVLTLIVGVFKVLEKAIGRSEKATESFARVGAFISGIFNGMIAVLEPIVELLGDALVTAIEKPGEAWTAFVGALQTGYEVWKTQILDRFLGNLKILSGTFEKGVLKMRIAWNEFTGDSEETEKLEKSLEKVNKKIEEGYEAHRIANEQLVNGFKAVVDGVNKFGDKAKEAYDKASTATEGLANSERRLVENRIALEKQQLTSLRLAEKQRQIRDDTSKTMEERIAANKQLGVILAEQSKKELALAQLSLDIAKKKVIANGDDIASLEEVGAAEVKILEIKERITGQLSEQIVNETGLKKEAKETEKADEQALADFKKGLRAEEAESKIAAIEREKAENILALENLKLTEEEKIQLLLDIDTDYRAKKRALKVEEDAIDTEAQLVQDEIDLEAKRALGEKVLEDELSLLERRRQQEVAVEGLRQSQIDAINREYAGKKKVILDTEEEQAKGKDIAILESALGAAASAFGDSKALSVAGALINTYKGISEVWSEKSETGLVGAGLAQKIATTAIVATQGFGAVKKIMSTTAPGVSGGGGGGGGGGGMPGIAMPTIPTATSSEVSDLSASNASRSGVDTSIGNQATQTASANVQAGKSGNVTFSESSYQSFQDQVVFKEDKSTI